MTRRAWPEAHICCALPLGKGTTLTIKTRRNSCTLQATLSMQGVFQRFPSATLFLFIQGIFMSELILHHYTLSPFSEKARAMFGYAGLEWQSVTVAEMPPRHSADKVVTVVIRQSCQGSRGKPPSCRH